MSRDARTHARCTHRVHRGRAPYGMPTGPRRRQNRHSSRSSRLVAEQSGLGQAQQPQALTGARRCPANASRSAPSRSSLRICAGRSCSPRRCRSLSCAICASNALMRAGRNAAVRCGAGASCRAPSLATYCTKIRCSIVLLAANVTRAASEAGRRQKCRPRSSQNRTSPPASSRQTIWRMWKFSKRIDTTMPSLA